MAVSHKTSELSFISRNLGYILALLGAGFFSLKAIFAKIAYGPEGATNPEIDVITLLTLRALFALPFYIVIGIIAWKERSKSKRKIPDTRQILLIMAMGLVGYYACAYLDFLGLTLITAQLERLILFTYPFFVVLFGAMFFGGRITLWNMGPLLFAYSGIVLIFYKGNIATGDFVLTGSLLVLSAAMLFGLYQLIAQKYILRFGSRIFTCLAMIAASLGVVAHFLTENSLLSLFELPSRLVWIGFLIAIISTVLASFLINAGLERVGPEAVAVVSSISPIITSIMAIVVLKEPFGLVDAVGTLMVIGGIGLYTWKDSKKNR